MANKKKKWSWKRFFYMILFVFLLPVILIEALMRAISSAKRKKQFLSTVYDKNMFLSQTEIEKVDIMEGYEFERFVKTLFFYLGYDAELTPKGKDFGADLILNKDNEKTAVQVKRYSGKVGIKAVQEIVGAKKHYKADETMVVTNNYFTPEAEMIAKEYCVRLIDRSELIELMGKVKEKLGSADASSSSDINSLDMYKFRI